MEQIFDRILSAFSVEYMLSVIMASYFIIKLISTINGGKAIKEVAKRIITFLVGAVSLVAFKTFTDLPFETLVTSYLAAVFLYDSAIKYLLKKFDIDYTKTEEKDADINKPS